MKIYTLYDSWGDMVGAFSTPQNAILAIEKREFVPVESSFSDREGAIVIHNIPEGVRYVLHEANLDSFFPIS